MGVRRRSYLAAAALVAALVAVGAVRLLGGGGGSAGPGVEPGTRDFSVRFAGYEPAREPNADPAKVVWPAFVIEAGPEVKRLYEFQLANGELMRYVPCFCGCYREAGHRSNRDCYVRRVNPDGSAVLDAMAPT